MNKCVKGPTILVITSALTVNSNVFAGVAYLSKPLLNVLTFQLISAQITQSSGLPTFTSPTSHLLAIQSARLGSQMSKNPFQFGSSVDAINQGVNAVSNVIGLVTTPLGGDLVEDYVPVSKLNPEIKFCKAQQIDRFDWSLAPVTGSMTTNQPSIIELVFSFTPACDCNPF